MPVYVVQVTVLPRPALLDPEGETITHAAHRLGYGDIRRIRAGRAFALEIEAPSPDAAALRAQHLAQQLLHNPVVEVFTVKVLEASMSSTS